MTARDVDPPVRTVPGTAPTGANTADLAATVSAAARERLGRVADALIPAGEGLPSATQAGVHAELLDQVAKARPDLIPPLIEALDALGSAAGGPDLERVERLAQDAPRLHEALTLVVAGAYLMSPRVVVPLKYAYEESKFVDPRDIMTVVSDGLLDQVLERGPIYRLPPDAPAGHDS